MASNFTKDDLKFFEDYLKEHPIPKEFENEPYSNVSVFDDNRDSARNKASLSILAKMVLEGKIK